MYIDFYCTEQQAQYLITIAKEAKVTPHRLIRDCMNIYVWCFNQTQKVGCIVDPLPDDRSHKFRVTITEEEFAEWETILYVTNVRKTKLIYGALRELLPFMRRVHREDYFEQLFKDAEAEKKGSSI